jgi:hypothetical protein
MDAKKPGLYGRRESAGMTRPWATDWLIPNNTGPSP